MCRHDYRGEEQSSASDHHLPDMGMLFKHIEVGKGISWRTDKSAAGNLGIIYHDRLPFPYVRGREYQTES